MKNASTPYVEVKTVTWCKDSHGLFDYESKNVTFTRTKVESNSCVYKEGNDIHIYSSGKQKAYDQFKQNSLNTLCSIISHSNHYSLEFDKRQLAGQMDSHKLFLVVQSLKNKDGTQKGYNLEVGDIIRLGRIEYKVIEYQNHHNQVYSLLRDSFISQECPFKPKIKVCENDSRSKKQCRICLMDEQDTQEELVNPCNCKGTSEYVHIQCLQDWISSKLKKKVHADIVSYYWKKLNCEVCKVPLPDLVEIKGINKELTPIVRPQSPYILLERVFYDKSKQNADDSKMMVLINVEGTQEIKFGRGHECDLRENDISVSRLHAFIRYNGSHFNIVDNNSKFGTLVLLRNSFKLEMDRKIALQLGRNVLTLSVKESQSNPVQISHNPVSMSRLIRLQSPKHIISAQLRPRNDNYYKHPAPSSRVELFQSEFGLNGSFLD